MTDIELEAWYRRILAFDKFRRIRQRRSAAIAQALALARLAAALALAATLAASTAMAVLEAAKLNQVGTDG